MSNEHQTKHTPGPWSRHSFMDEYNSNWQKIETEEGSHFFASAITIGSGKKVIATAEARRFDGKYELGYPQVESLEELEANAALIIAAPDLLEELKSAVARVELANAEGDQILSAWLPGARAAIAKAEGRAE